MNHPKHLNILDKIHSNQLRQWTSLAFGFWIY